MAKKIIAVSEIQKGDRIKVTYMDRDMKETRTGIAYRQNRYNDHNWYDKNDVIFFTHLSSAVVELLDRPKPTVVLPTGEGAVVEYMKDGPTHLDKGPRIATLSRGAWNVTGQITGNPRWHATDPGTVTPEWLTDMVNSNDVIDFEVHFAGVTK